MESECRVPSACCRPRVLVLQALFWSLVSLRVFGAALLSEEKTTVKQQSAPCWLLEDFVVAAECSPCTAFQTVRLHSSEAHSHVATSVQSDASRDPERLAGLCLQLLLVVVVVVVTMLTHVVVVSDVLGVLQADGLRGASQLHQIQQGRVQELPLVPPGGASLLEVRGLHAGPHPLLLGGGGPEAEAAGPPRLREGEEADREHLERRHLEERRHLGGRRHLEETREGERRHEKERGDR